MRKADIIAELESLGIEFDPSLKKAELEALLPVEEAAEEIIEEAPAEEVVEAPKGDIRFHEGIEVLDAEDVSMEGHAMERLVLANGTETIIPKE